MNILDWLQNWYSEQSDGDWEEQYGITIDTLDNPGWSLKIDLRNTSLDSKKFERIEVDIDDKDWYFCWVENRQFHGASSPQHLTSMLQIFKKWSEQQNK